MSSIIMCDSCKKPIPKNEKSTPIKIQIGSEVYELEDTCESCTNIIKSIVAGKYHQPHVKSPLKTESTPISKDTEDVIDDDRIKQVEVIETEGGDGRVTKTFEVSKTAYR